MPPAKVKPIFRGLTIAAAGDLGGSAQWTDTNIARWVSLREGRFVREMSDEVTHVVCSSEEFRKGKGLSRFLPSHAFFLLVGCLQSALGVLLVLTRALNSKDGSQAPQDLPDRLA